VLATPDELWALRYPGQHALHVIERPAGKGDTPTGQGDTPAGQGLHVRSATSSVHVPALHAVPSVVVASERLDGESGWRMLASGELLHVAPDLSVTSSVVLPDPPRRLVPLPPGNPNIDT
jgi:predicted glutamine amidotransferase